MERKSMQFSKKTNPAIYLALACILLVTCVAFYPSVHGGFVWDDDGYILKNHFVKHMSLKNLKQAFTSFIFGNYHPFVIISYTWEYFFFGLNPLPYHVTNILLHLINCILVFVFLLSLTRSIPVAFITGLLFGIHPLHVESVAWISGRKDLLYTLFFIGGLLSYLSYLKEHKNKFFLYSLILFIMSLLSKVMAISFPFVLLLIDYCMARKLTLSTLKEKIPFFILSIIFGMIAIFSQQPAAQSSILHSTLLGFFVASHGLIFYLVKTVVPINLVALYPYPLNATFFLPVQYLLAPVGVFLLAVPVYYSIRYTKKILLGALFFLITVFPAIQFIPVGHATAADRYTYVPLIGIFLILSNLFIWLWDTKIRKTTLPRVSSFAFASLVTALLVLLTFNQCKVWNNNISLWENAINKSSQNYTAYNNLGTFYYYENDYKKALSSFLRAIEINPEYANAYNGVCTIYSSKKENEKALPFCKKALEINPRSETAHLNLADLYRSSDIQLAMEMYHQVLLLNPDSDAAHYRLCSTMLSLREHDLALPMCMKVIELNPDNANAHKNIGDIHLHGGRLDRAFLSYIKALSINPYQPEAQNNLAVIYFYIKDYDSARKHFNAAASLGYKVHPEFQHLLSNPQKKVGKN